jgi:hypothetical protein
MENNNIPYCSNHTSATAQAINDSCHVNAYSQNEVFLLIKNYLYYRHLEDGHQNCNHLTFLELHNTKIAKLDIPYSMCKKMVEAT